MITNAIPGISNLDFFANTVQSKGIAATNEQTADFQKALSNANTQKQTAAVNLSVAKTLTSTGAVRDNNAAAAYEKTQNVQNEADGKVTEISSKSDSGQGTSNVENTKTDNTKAAKNRAQAEGNVNENPSATEVTEDSSVVQETMAEINENPDGEAIAMEIADEALSELEQALLDSSRDLMQQLADSMGVDIKDIENAMATLGLTNVAILDPMNMTQIVAQISGADDVMAIVTNADVYLNVQNMQDAVDTTRHNLMEEFNLSEEGLSSALENFNEELEQKNAERVVQTEENPAITEQTNITRQEPFPAEAVRLDLTGEGTVKEVTQQTTQPSSSDPEVTAPEEPKFRIEITTEQQPQDTGHGQNNEPKHENMDGSQYNQMINQISSSLSEVVETESYGQMARSNAQDIMDQITEFIKMNVKADSTTMEMQLHPASLGNVNVIIEAAKDGNVVAKFLTQNEDVRAAIEGQLQLLQDKLNEQGVKVTAVEVTVNAGAFDQTLNDSQSQKEDDQDAQESIRKPMRRIRLEDISLDEIDEIDEADQLTAEMMAINGNSVDFSA